MTKCEHGHDGDIPSVVDEDGLTACCGAYSSFSIDTLAEYCKCCYAEVTGGAVTPRITFKLPKPDNS